LAKNNHKKTGAGLFFCIGFLQGLRILELGGDYVPLQFLGRALLKSVMYLCMRINLVLRRAVHNKPLSLRLLFFSGSASLLIGIVLSQNTVSIAGCTVPKAKAQATLCGTNMPIEYVYIPIRALQDTYVDSSSPTTNYGQSGVALVGNNDATIVVDNTQEQHALIQFELSMLQAIPTQATEIVLMVPIKRGANAFEPINSHFYLSLTPLTASFNELTVNWNNKPTAEPDTSPYFKVQQLPTASITNSTTHYDVPFTITQYIKDIQNNTVTAHHGFILKGVAYDTTLTGQPFTVQFNTVTNGSTSPLPYIMYKVPISGTGSGTP
jgi:hypothetical protein